MNSRAYPEARYARAVERALAAASGRAVVMSPRDFALVSGWIARGVPLAVLLEQIEHRRSRGKDVRSLASIAKAIEHAWAAVVDGRAGAQPVRESAAPAPPAGIDDLTLLAEASPEALQEAERAADAALAPWRSRMTPAALAATRRRAVLDRLRRPRS